MRAMRGAAAWLLGAAALTGAGAVLAQNASELAAQRGRQLFNQGVPACALCHTLKDAGATGEIGPVLDELQPEADRVLRALRQGVGVMPSFAGRLNEADLQALAQYVARASRGQP
ncbi:SorU family sulfite dehydrogenase c-type cytochrome subunit [Curvibacter microcysteis]|uniref:SorU family sulfite dehydrogenase c-type cytochrome subunit n=1 Tax=Curvibacter microcysteis TaxID=3026419 RepID=UPI0039083F51